MKMRTRSSGAHGAETQEKRKAAPRHAVFAQQRRGCNPPPSRWCILRDTHPTLGDTLSEGERMHLQFPPRPATGKCSTETGAAPAGTARPPPRVLQREQREPRDRPRLRSPTAPKPLTLIHQRPWAGGGPRGSSSPTLVTAGPGPLPAQTRPTEPAPYYLQAGARGRRQRRPG